MDLRSIKHLSKIATQCRAFVSSVDQQCVTSYYVFIKSYSNDDFAPVCSNDHVCPRLFTGNEATDNLELVVVNRFYPLIAARYVRVNPQTWADRVSMRWELYGCH